MERSKTSQTLNHWYDFSLKVLVEGIIVGAVAGFIVVTYRLLLMQADNLRNNVYNVLQNKPWFYIVGWFMFLIIAGIVLGLIVKRVPMIKGSGIPQVKGFLLRQLKIDWLKELLLKFIGGLISIGLGMSLGREGPSVQLGASTGVGFSRVMKRFHLEEKYLVTAGACAGLSAAFNAPLAGVIFALEELHKSFSPLILTCAMGASVMADFISSHFFGLTPVFDFENIAILPLNQYGAIIILGILAGIMGKLFNDSLLWVQKYFGESKRIKDIYKPVLPLILSGILAFTLPAVLGGGHHLIVELSQGKMLFSVLLILLSVKFVFTLICYGSGVPGGIFLPILVLGALLGKGYGQFIVQYFHVDEIYVMNFLILAMAAYFTAVVKAPVTGSILITEMTGSFQHLLPLITICMIAQVTTHIFNSKAIYDVLLENMLKGKKGNWLKSCGDKKILMEVPISFGSEVEHRLVRDIQWPQDCLLVGIKRGDKEIIPNGSTKIYAGDYLIVLTDEVCAPSLKPVLIMMGEENYRK